MKIAEIVERVAKSVMAYVEVKQGNVKDPKRLLDKCNRKFGTKLNVRHLADNWGFNSAEWQSPKNVYTTVDENGDFSGAMYGIHLYGHFEEETHILILDEVVYNLNYQEDKKEMTFR
jgi:hypothetical protein